MAFNDEHSIGLTVSKEEAEKIAHEAPLFSATPANSVQHSVLTFAPSHLTGLVGRMRPFMGQLGSCPSIPFPDSHNAGRPTNWQPFANPYPFKLIISKCTCFVVRVIAAAEPVSEPN